MSINRHRAVLGAWVAALAAAAWTLLEATGPLLERATVSGAGPDAWVAVAAAALGWLVLAWLTVALLATAAEDLGVPLARWVVALAPRTLRAAVRASLGVGLASGMLPVTAVHASTPAGPARSATVVVDDNQPRWPSLDRPAEPAAERPTSQRSYLVVRHDTLWAIAAAHLPGDPTDQQIALAWPRWWRLNRAVIGPDPGLIHPGQVLRIPQDLS